MDLAALSSMIRAHLSSSVSSASLFLVFLIAAGCSPTGSSALSPGHGSTHIYKGPVVQDSLRIRIFDLYDPTTAVLRSDSAVVLTSQNSTVTVSPGSPISVRVQGSGLLVGGATGFESGILVSLRAINHGTIDVTVNGLTNRTRSYTGTVSLRPDRRRAGGLVLVNRVPIEDYVAAVVATEYGLDDIEGARAMAILARTYALRSKNTAEEDYDHVDHSISQVFHGVGSIDSQSNSAANSTRGMILVHNGGLVESVYHASSGGHTANNEDVWNGAPVAYLRGRKDRYESSPYSQWSTTVDRGRLLRLLSNEFGVEVTGITVGGRSSDGRVQSLDLHSSGERKTISANDFRLVFRREFGVMALKSTLFRISKSGNSYVFNGSGFGHGVGLSQWGAHEMAKKGKSFEDILAYYYKDVDILTLEGINKKPEALPPRPTTLPETPSTDKVQSTSDRRRGW